MAIRLLKIWSLLLGFVQIGIINSSTHWVVTEDGKVQSQVCFDVKNWHFVEKMVMKTEKSVTM